MELVERYLSGLSIPQLSLATGVPRSTIRRELKRAGVLRTRAAGVRLAGSSQRLGSGTRGKKRRFAPSHLAALKQAAIARGERTAKGTSLKPNGYVEITRGPNKGRGEHRVVLEKKLGRSLQSNEVAHHKNERRGDNHPDNLEPMTRAAHTAHHRKAGV